MAISSRVSNQMGFTLVEVLVSTLVGVAVVGGFMTMASFQVETTRDQTAQIDLQQSVRDVAELFARDVRRSGANPACVPDFEGIEVASSSTIRLRSDFDGDGLSTGLDEEILYTFSGHELSRMANGHSELLLENVEPSTSSIQYFDAAGDELLATSLLDASERASVRRVRFVIETAKLVGPERNMRALASSNVNLRNRFFVRDNSC